MFGKSLDYRLLARTFFRESPPGRKGVEAGRWRWASVVPSAGDEPTFTGIGPKLTGIGPILRLTGGQRGGLGEGFGDYFDVVHTCVKSVKTRSARFTQVADGKGDGPHFDRSTRGQNERGFGVLICAIARW